MSLILREDLPDLNTDFEVESVDLSAEYWSPTETGEKRRMFFMGIENRTAPDHNDPEKEVELPCAVFVLRGDDGEFRAVINGSKRLVAAFENSALDRGKPVQVTYLGKKKNRSNAHMSDDWSVVTLKMKGK